MSARIRSLNVGSREPNAAKSVGVTGIGKRSVDEAMVRAPGRKHDGLGSGLVGDFIGDTKHHGGDTQAVYAFAREELDYWAVRLGREIPDGLFGENLTTEGVAVDDALVGERWLISGAVGGAVGDEVVLEVSAPRVPCATFAARMAVPGWARTFSEVGRTGAYLSVVTPGVVRRGDAVVVISRPDHGITLPLVFRAITGDLEAAERVLAADCLLEEESAWLRDRVAARTS